MSPTAEAVAGILADKAGRCAGPAEFAGFAEELLAAVPPGPIDDGPVVTLADLYFDARMHYEVSRNVHRTPLERDAAARTSAALFLRFAATVKGFGGEWVVLSQPTALVRWDAATARLDWRTPHLAGHVTVSRPRREWEATA
jgi:hypothetical protein